MTEEEWIACRDPEKMIMFLAGMASLRKLRLFACSCCRNVWYLLLDERSRSGLEAAEDYADDLGSLAEDKGVRDGCLRAMEDASGDSESAELGHAKWYAANAVVSCTWIPFWWTAANDTSQEARQAEAWYIFEKVHQGIETLIPEPELSDGSLHSEFLHDMFGNPFRPITIDPTWLTPPVNNLASVAYEQRAMPSGELDTTRLAILADALEDAGCDNPEILNHLRSPGPHVRGCWPVDLLLGKE